MNSGAGCIGGIFVHSKNFDKDYPRFDGWWGNQDKTRFQMKPGMILSINRLYNYRIWN